jgi:hypothetical protein
MPAGPPIEPHGLIRFSSPKFRFCRSALAGLLGAGLLAASEAAPGTPALEADHVPDASGLRLSNDGTIDLEWSLEDAPEATFELEQTGDLPEGARRIRYRGRDTASVVTGLDEGDYRFRVRALDPDGTAGDWSEPVVLRVEFMERRTLFLLLGTGALVVTLTIGAIVRGFLETR